jgi:hypothetical protein
MIEHLTDAAEELGTVPGCSGGENTGSTPLRELGYFRQGGGVGPWRPGRGDDPIVARHFPCKRHLIAEPINCGLNWERGFNQSLSQVAPVVAAMQVGDFVQDNLLQFGV